MSLKVSESQTLSKAVCFVFHHAIIMQCAEIGTEREKMITVCIMGVYAMLDFILNTHS